MTSYIRTIPPYANPETLLQVAKKVKNPQSTEVILTIQAMKKLALEWEQGHRSRCEGLAANQIGSLLRIVILRKTDVMAPVEPDPEDYIKVEPLSPGISEATGRLDEDAFEEANYIKREWDRRFGSFYDPWHVLINPQILEESGEQDSIEGCLSLPGKSYKVTRPTMVVFKYMNPKGKIVGPQVVQGFGAAALSHEINHLDGILIDMIGSEVTDTNKESHL